MAAKLLKPLDYLKIKHPQKKRYDHIIPLALTVLSLCIFMLIPVKPSIFGEKGLVSLIGGLLQVLTGFYIVSLSAIATFNKKGMDSPMAGEPPTLRTFSNGEDKTIELSRRRFLCLLFGYLSLLSILIYFFGGIASLLKGNATLIPLEYIVYAKYLFLFFYLYAFFNLIITTFLGLYYLVDRIHRSTPAFTNKSSE